MDERNAIHKILEKRVVIPADEVLIRDGDILNPLGIFRSAMLHDGTIHRSDYEDLVKRNWSLDRDKRLPNKYRLRIDHEWNSAIDKFRGIDILDHASSEVIVIKK